MNAVLFLFGGGRLVVVSPVFQYLMHEAGRSGAEGVGICSGISKGIE